MSDLTTQSLYRNAYKKDAPVGGNDPALAQWIAAVSDAVERHCDRTFGITTYKKWLDGCGTAQMVLPEWPIVSVFGLSVATQEVLRIQNGTAIQASASTETTGVRLYCIDSTGTESDTLIDYATYKTIQTISDAINAMGNGWQATVLEAMGSEPAILIKPYCQDMCVSPQYVQLEMADQFEPCRVRSESNRVVERTFSGDSAIWYPAVLSAQGAIFPEGRSNIFMWYKAGYVLPVDNAGHTTLSNAASVTLPPSLVHIVNNIVKGVNDAYDQTIGGMQTESIMDYSYSMAADSQAIIPKLIDQSARVLSPFRKVGTMWA